MTSAITPGEPDRDTLRRGHRAIDTSSPDAVVRGDTIPRAGGPPLAHSGVDIVHHVIEGGGIRIGLVCGGVESAARGLCYARLDYTRSAKYHGWMYDYRGIGTAMAGIMAAESVCGYPSGVAPHATLGVHQLGHMGESVDGWHLAVAISDAVAAASDVIIIESIAMIYDAGVDAALHRASDAGIPVVMGVDMDSPSHDKYRWLIGHGAVIAVAPCYGDGAPTIDTASYPEVDILAPGHGVIRSHDYTRSYQWSGGNVAAAYFAGQLALLRAMDVEGVLPWGHRPLLLAVLRRSCRMSPCRIGRTATEMTWLDMIPMAEHLMRGTELPGLMIGHPRRAGGVEDGDSAYDYDDYYYMYPQPHSPSAAV